MSDEDDFEPRLGRMRARGGRRGRKYLHRVLAAANLARGSALSGHRPRGFSGSRIGRGSGVGRMLASRDHLAAYRARRVVIKSRIVRLAGKGAAGAAAHLRYLKRDGTTREGESGRLYGAVGDDADGKAFLERGAGDRHQFRFIVSAEDGAEYDDLKPLTRRLMQRMEADLGTTLDWVAVDHFNTGHPHTHIIVRGTDDRGRDLVIARDYLTRGMRERAAELVDLDLGPRDERAIEQRLRAEIEQERLTGIDRRLLAQMDGERIVDTRGGRPFEQSLRAGRLSRLGRMGLADDLGAGRWRLAEDLEDTLKRMGERGDIIRTMQRAFSAGIGAPAPAEHAIYDPAQTGAKALVGRVVERGLSDELRDRHYLIVEATDGHGYYVDVGQGDALAPLAIGAVVHIAPSVTGPRAVDRTISEVARANGGRYDIDAHLRHDPSASEAFARSHVRRLEAMRRAGTAARNPDGSWTIPEDHLARVSEFERRRAADRPVGIGILSPVPIEQLVDAEAATWLDRELVSGTPEPLRDAGFGAAARDAQARRRQWLIGQGFAAQDEGAVRYRPDMLAALQRRELLRVAGQLATELDLDFVEARPGERIDGVLRRPVELASGRYALVVKSREFTLVPWRPVLDRQVGKAVSGIMRERGVNWSFGRSRGGPAIT